MFPSQDLDILTSMVLTTEIPRVVICFSAAIKTMRELMQGVLEYAFFNTPQDTIHPEDINLMGDIKPDNKWKEDKDVFVKAWKAAGGNVSRLANLLNVSLGNGALHGILTLLPLVVLNELVLILPIWNEEVGRERGA